MKLYIRDAKMLCERLDAQAVLILSVGRDGVVHVVTYGETKHKCKAIGIWGRGLWQHAISIIPFRTVFGWGNSGVPKPLMDEELVSLSPKALAYAEQFK